MHHQQIQTNLVFLENIYFLGPTALPKTKLAENNSTEILEQPNNKNDSRDGKQFWPILPRFEK